jgi:hypothetical protein
MPNTKQRVPKHTASAVNQRISRATTERVKYFEKHKREISERLEGLDQEWDIERAIEANASAIAFVGVVLGYFVHPYFLAVPAVVTAFLFQHAVQGWCPPIPVLRRLGFRTVYEIEDEAQALKALRGDFAKVNRSRTPAVTALKAARA